MNGGIFMLGTVLMIAIVFVLFNFKRIIKYAILAFFTLSIVLSGVSVLSEIASTIVDFFV